MNYTVPERRPGDEQIEKIKDLVDAVYKFRDEFVLEHGLAAAGLRDQQVEGRMKEAMQELEVLSQHIDLQTGVQLGHVCYERGRLLSVCPAHEGQAEQHLGKASKFNIPGSWTLLGECLYSRGDYTMATTCFNKTLARGDDKVALRNLSILMRSQPSSSPEQREGNINKGVEYARRAVKQDPADGRSWMVLGNSLLAAFFGVQTNTTTLQACRAAYARAEQDKRASMLPELHYSKFQVFWYEEQYSVALSSLSTACQLEPSWRECQMRLQQCYAFLRSLLNIAKKKGQLSNKRLKDLIKSIRSSHLGPYEQAGTALSGNAQPELVSFSQLQPGTNTDKIVQGMVVATLVPDSGIPFVMFLVDSEGSCLPVTVYNWAPGTEVKIGDAVAVLAPVLKEQSVLLEGGDEESSGGGTSPKTKPGEKEVTMTSGRRSAPVGSRASKQKTTTVDLAEERKMDVENKNVTESESVNLKNDSTENKISLDDPKNEINDDTKLSVSKNANEIEIDSVKMKNSNDHLKKDSYEVRDSNHKSGVNELPKPELVAEASTDTEARPAVSGMMSKRVMKPNGNIESNKNKLETKPRVTTFVSKRNFSNKLKDNLTERKPLSITKTSTASALNKISKGVVCNKTVSDSKTNATCNNNAQNLKNVNKPVALNSVRARVSTRRKVAPTKNEQQECINESIKPSVKTSIKPSVVSTDNTLPSTKQSPLLTSSNNSSNTNRSPSNTCKSGGSQSGKNDNNGNKTDETLTCASSKKDDSKATPSGKQKTSGSRGFSKTGVTPKASKSADINKNSSSSVATDSSQEALLKSIRVAAPVMLVVNKRLVAAGQVAASCIVSQSKPE